MSSKIMTISLPTAIAEQIDAHLAELTAQGVPPRQRSRSHLAKVALQHYLAAHIPNTPPETACNEPVTDDPPEVVPEPTPLVEPLREAPEASELQRAFKGLLQKNYQAAFEVLQSLECESFGDVLENNKTAALSAALTEKGVI